jgi:hypothetical protein
MVTLAICVLVPVGHPNGVPNGAKTAFKKKKKGLGKSVEFSMHSRYQPWG